MTKDTFVHFQLIIAQILIFHNEYCLLSCVIVDALAQTFFERIYRSSSLVKKVLIVNLFQFTNVKNEC